MAEEIKEPKKGGGEFRVPPRTWILWIAILVATLLLFYFKSPQDTPETFTQAKFMQEFHAKTI